VGGLSLPRKKSGGA